MANENYGNYDLIFGYDDMKAARDVGLTGTELQSFIKRLYAYLGDTGENTIASRRLTNLWNALEKFAASGSPSRELESFMETMGEYPIRYRGRRPVYDKYGSAIQPTYYYVNGIITDLLKLPEVRALRISPKDF